MREFVYISESKLVQFVPERRRFWGRFGLQKVSAKVPWLEATIDVGPVPAAPHRSLDDVVAHLLREARWFDDDRVSAGGWIFFDSPLLQEAVWLTSAAASAAVFLDVADEGSLRLFLHGAARHLVGMTPPSKDACLVADGVSPTHASLSDALGVETWESLSYGLGYRRDDPLPRTPGSTAVVDVAVLRDALTWMFSTLVTDEYHRSRAAWMAGCARVTSMVRLGSTVVVTASPLYVERVPPPD